MMVLFQNKIIYMPFLPPNARSDTIAEYAAQCGDVKWREEHIRSGDGTDVALAVAEVGSLKVDAVEKIVLYFQGENCHASANSEDPPYLLTYIVSFIFSVLMLIPLRQRIFSSSPPSRYFSSPAYGHQRRRLTSSEVHWCVLPRLLEVRRQGFRGRNAIGC